MGNILVDDRPLEPTFRESATVAEVFESVRDGVLGGGRVVVGVIVDGSLLEWEDGSPIWEQPFDRSMTLEITTDLPIVLSGALMDRAIECLPELRELQRQAANLVRREETQTRGVEMTLDILSRWKELQEAIVGVRALHQIDFDQEPWQEFGDDLGAAFRNVSERISEMREAFELRDFVLVGDLLEFEMVPLVDTWLEVCRKFAQLLRREFSA
jgi:hypothetical protein